MTRRIVTVVLALLLSAFLLVIIWPQAFGLEAAPVIAQVVSLRGLDVAIAVVAIVILLLLAAWKPARRFALALTIPLVVFSLISVAILGARGFGDSTAAGDPTAAKTSSDITVLSWNTRGGAPGAAAIAKLALAEHADVVALPGTPQAMGIDIEHIMSAAGEPMWVLSRTHGLVYGSYATTLLVSATLGKYSADNSVGDTSVSSSIIAKPDNGIGPTLIAVHAVSPRPQEMRNWRSDLRYLSTICTGSNLIMAGDFNSTIDNLRPLSTKSGADFGQCTDAGAASHSAAIGSWPTNLPELLGAQIDHVMYGSAWKVTSMHVIGTEDSAGSDHRPIVTTLAPNT
jgi:endonuclease/exonuclease/phosphatase (EEP) superfamily protein YafD